ncbi:MAG: DUF4173 domain-containing protein [Gemmatimonadaceae bacterium]
MNETAPAPAPPAPPAAHADPCNTLPTADYDGLEHWDAPRPTTPTIPSDPFREKRATTRTILGATACGLAGDLLLRDGHVYANFSVYVLLAIVATYSVLRARSEDSNKLATWLFMASALFGALFSVRDSETVFTWNLLLCATMFALAIAATTPEFRSRATRVRDVISALFLSACDAVFGAFTFLLSDLPQLFSISETRKYGFRLVARGLVIAAVLVFVFGGLLRVGDPVFDHGLSNMFDWNLPNVATHLLVFAATAWPVIGMQWRNARGSSAQRSLNDIAIPTFINRVDVLAVLTTLNALFASFVAVQLRVLFGGQAYVLATTGLTLAEYARSGFFVLFVVAGLVLCMLLAMNATHREGSIGNWPTSRRLSGSLMALVGVVLASAVGRMALYFSVFGASADRVYAFGAMSWLAVVYVVFGVTVLRNKSNAFAFGTLGVSAAAVLLFNVVNTEALVTKYNLRRAVSGAGFDMTYALSLGADAVPALVDGIVRTPIDAIANLNDGKKPSALAACGSVAELVRRWHAPSQNDASGWNVSRWRANRAVESNLSALQARSCAVTSSAALTQSK